MNLLNQKDNIDYEKIKEILEKGGVVIYPTDTVYGIGCTLTSLKGIEKIYLSKERDKSSPLIALISKKDYWKKIATVSEDKEELLEKLMNKYWPGALTVILKKKDIVPNEMVSYGDTVGIRVPSLRIARDIIEKVGGIMPTTSANISGEKTPKTYFELSEKIKERADIVVEYKEEILGVESTIIDLTKEIPIILREGAISRKELEEAIKSGGKNESTKSKSE